MHTNCCFDDYEGKDDESINNNNNDNAALTIQRSFRRFSTLRNEKDQVLSIQEQQKQKTKTKRKKSTNKKPKPFYVGAINYSKK